MKGSYDSDAYNFGFRSGCARGAKDERQRIIDAIRERANKWAALVGREPAAARKAMYDVADELERRKLAP